MRFDVLQDPEVNSRFYIYEAYKDEDAVAFHKTTPHYKTCVAKLEALSRPIKRDYDHILKTLLTNYLQAYNINRCCMWHLLMIKAHRML